jgi:lipopolysaccharide export system protein LptC
MAGVRNTYSQVISWLKVLLAVLAVGIFAMIFLVARTIDPSQSLPFANFDVAEMVREQRVGSPKYSGVSADGSSITFSAKSAVPDPGDLQLVDIIEPSAQIETLSGEYYDITADKGRIDSAAQLANLSGGVRLETSNGYAFATDAMQLDFNSSELTSDSDVIAHGPNISITAGNMTLRRNNDDGYLVVFNGGVKLVYQPQQ